MSFVEWVRKSEVILITRYVLKTINPDMVSGKSVENFMRVTIFLFNFAIQNSSSFNNKFGLFGWYTQVFEKLLKTTQKQSCSFRKIAVISVICRMPGCHLLYFNCIRIFWISIEIICISFFLLISEMLSSIEDGILMIVTIYHYAYQPKRQ